MNPRIGFGGGERPTKATARHQTARWNRVLLGAILQDMTRGFRPNIALSRVVFGPDVNQHGTK